MSVGMWDPTMVATLFVGRRIAHGDVIALVDKECIYEILIMSQGSIWGGDWKGHG